eukprot:scaffold151429_cov20-Tisochrysis_lutea.AAC.1
MATDKKPSSASKKPYTGKPLEHTGHAGVAVRSSPVSIPSKFDTVLYTGPRATCARTKAQTCKLGQALGRLNMQKRC